MPSPVQPERRWLHFSLRQLIVATLIVGACLSWIGAQLKWIHDRQQALRWIRPLRARQIAASRGMPVPPAKGFYLLDKDVGPPWSPALFGAVGVEQIEVDQRWLSSSARVPLALPVPD